MENIKAINFLFKLPTKLNKFYKTNSKKKLIIKNKSYKKNILNPVTNFDKGFEKVIRKNISKFFSKDGIIGEEFKEKKTKNKNRWVIDPIDGTKAFISDLPTWSNLIGYLKGNKAEIGMANFPKLKKFYISDGRCSYLIENKKKLKIKTNNKNNLTKVNILLSLHKKKDLKIIKKLSKMNKNLSRITLDALGYCLLAEGKIDAVIESDLKIYDVAAIVPIVNNAGGLITTWNNKNAIKGGHILATSNKKLHYKLLQLLNH